MCVDDPIRPLVLILPKFVGYVKMFKYIDGEEKKNKKLISFRIHDYKLLEKFKTIWIKIEDSKKKNELDVLQVYNVRYIKARIRTKVYTNFRCLNMSEEVQNENILQPFLLVPCLFITSNYI